MRNIIFLLCAVLVFSLIQILHSQPDEIQIPENHISIGYGFVNIQEFGESFSSGLSFGLRTLNHQSSFGPLAVRYEKDVSRRFTTGLSATWFQDKILVSEDNLNSSIDDTYMIDRRYLFIMAMARVNYHHSRDLRVYSRISGGINMHRQEISEVQGNPSQELTNPQDFAWQLDVIGINFGHEVSVFAEFSISMISMFKFGVIYNF
jgi:hypothetical protein